MDWSFLNKMDKNLLYLYARGVTKQDKESHFMQLYSPEDTGDEERNEMLKSEMKRQTALYIIWFVYRYILSCETFEEAEKYVTPEISKQFKLNSLFQHYYIYIGVNGTENEIRFWNNGELEMKVVLEILYNRYNFFEQLECYIRRTEGTKKKTRSRCIRILKETLEIVKNNPEYEAMYQKYIVRGVVQ